MNSISFIIPTTGNNQVGINHIIDSIELQRIPEYEIILVGGAPVQRAHTRHIPFDDSVKPTAWLTRKKNLGAMSSTYDILVVMHDYHVFDVDWYSEFEKFGTNWDICVHQVRHSAEQGNARNNGWRVEQVPGYPELPFAMTIPWDIDCFVPYMPIQGSYWVCKRHVMLSQPLDESLCWGQCDDIEWSSRVVPGWQGQKLLQNDFKIVANAKCLVRLNKHKPLYAGAPDWDAIERSFDELWQQIRAGYRRPGVYHYEQHLGQVIKS